jgi:hypothetical protein
MKITRLVKIVPFAFITCFFINYLFQVVILGSWNAMNLAGIRRPASELNPVFIAVDLFIQMTFLTYLVLSLNKAKSYKLACIIGSLFAAALYIHFGLLNMFILPGGYPATMIFSDTIAVGITFSIAASVITLLDIKWNK